MKFLLSYSDGQYYATRLSDEEIAEHENAGSEIVDVPDEIADEWLKHVEKQREWHKYWSKLDNEWYMSDRD